MADIVISEFMDQAAVDGLTAEFSVVYDKGLADRPDELGELASQCRALIVRNRTQVRGPLLNGRNLKVIGRLGVGLDNIDCAACKARNITVIPATGANDQAVAEYVIAGLLLLLRKSYGESAAVAAGAWPRERLIGGEISGRLLGLVGFGSIARQTAKRAIALGMRVMAYDPYIPEDAPLWREHGVEPTGLESLLAASDAVSIHVPLTDGTRHLVNASTLGMMKRGAVFINAARGGVADEQALADVLASGQLGGALVDVFEKEPLPAGSPLAGAPNCILTPHIAGVTHESNIRVSALVADKVAQALRKDGKCHEAQH